MKLYVCRIDGKPAVVKKTGREARNRSYGPGAVPGAMVEVVEVLEDSGKVLIDPYDNGNHWVESEEIYEIVEGDEEDV